MIKALKNRKAEGYIDVAIAVLVIVFLLVLALSVFKLVTLKQDMKYMCEELVKTATLNGKVGDEVDVRFGELCAETGLSRKISITATYFNATTKTVQLGDTITVKLTYETSLAGFGDFELPFEVSVSSSGLSRIYWK